MEQLREMIARVARSQAPVHIYGESGTGKELVHGWSTRAAHAGKDPLLPSTAGAIPRS